MMERPLYFAYGSNINLDQMRYRCPDASVYGQAVLDNYRPALSRQRRCDGRTQGRRLCLRSFVGVN